MQYRERCVTDVMQTVDIRLPRENGRQVNTMSGIDNRLTNEVTQANKGNIILA